jgi:hypothetical protein
MLEMIFLEILQSKISKKIISSIHPPFFGSEAAVCGFQPNIRIICYRLIATRDLATFWH